MCGIWSYIALKNRKPDISKLFKKFYSLKHRGPDNSYFQTYGNAYVGFHRLAIVNDTFSSNQPFIIEDEHRTIVAIVNGEIYNYKEIYEHFLADPNFKATNKSDCFTIPLLYQHFTSQQSDNIQLGFTNYLSNTLKGEYAFIILEFNRHKALKRLVAGRDHIGVRPLYYNESALEDDNIDSCRELIFTSEIKGAAGYDVTEFPPGNVLDIHFDIFQTISKVNEYPYLVSFGHPGTLFFQDENKCLENVRKSVINSIECRLDADKPIGFLLSGGVDSSLVAALSAKILGRKIRTFCCGMGEGTDLQFARKVAEHIGSQHTEVLFTPEEGLAAIDDVIRTIESWDTTSVRASVVQYLVCKYIGTNTDCKIICVGEGVDEVCSSYLFNWYAPSGNELHETAIEYVKKMHYYDIKRADRCVARWGMEARVPLLDTEFIKQYWKIPADWRMPTYKGVEKWWLREAFRESGVLPDEVLWRQKEAQSDGVSSKEKSWFQIIQDFIEDKVTNEELMNAIEHYPYCTPVTKEAYYYRKIFCNIFGKDAQKIIPGFWQPKWSTDGKEVTDYIDPSARILKIYLS